MRSLPVSTPRSGARCLISARKLAGSRLLRGGVSVLCGAFAAAIVIGLAQFMMPVAAPIQVDAGKAAERAHVYAEGIGNRLRVADQTLRAVANDLPEQGDERVAAGATVQRYFETVAVVNPEGRLTPIHGTIIAMPLLSERTRQGLATGDSLVLTMAGEQQRPRVVMVRQIARPDAPMGLLVAVIAPSYLWPDTLVGKENSEWCVRDDNRAVLFCSGQRMQAALSRLMGTVGDDPSGNLAWRAGDAHWAAAYARRALPVSVFSGSWTVLVDAGEVVTQGDAEFEYGIVYRYLAALFAGLLVAFAVWRMNGLRNRRSKADSVSGSGHLDAPWALQPEGSLALQRCVIDAMIEMDRAILSGAGVDRLVVLAARHMLMCGGCDRVLLAILDREAPFRAMVVVGETAGQAPQIMGQALLDPAMGDLLATKPEGCWSEQLGDFTFLSPLVERGCVRALLLPLYEDAKPSGVIALGLTDRREPGADACAYARALADRLGVALIAVARGEALYANTHMDVTTALPNRRYLQEHLGPMLANTRREQQRLALLFIDLDEFKQVNSAGGHDCGDALLEASAKRLRGRVREEDLVVHFGGDEFVVVLPRISDALDARRVADKLIAALCENHSLEGGEFRLGASIGISIFPDDAQSTSELLRQAEFAMFRAKAAGRGQYAFFDETVNRRAIERTRLEADLRRALENREFVVFYQPQIDLESGAIDGAEALIRWNHPQRGMVPPGEFIPIAEQSSVILQIGAYVMRTACEQFRAWESAGTAPGRVSVNVTALELKQRDFADQVEAILRETGLRPFCLELEITEGLLVDDSRHIHVQLDRLRARGIRIAIDDFGTGYWSLSYLKRLPVDVVKIDQSFVRDIGKDEDSVSMVRAMIDIANSLGKITVAEGVETMEQGALLAKLGCKVGQGYLWSRPVPAVEFERLCRTWVAASREKLPSKRLAA